jgi:hypothetical protein
MVDGRLDWIAGFTRYSRDLFSGQSRAMISRITLSETERAAGALGSETIEHASRCFRKDGALIIENIVDPALIVRVRQAFGAAYAQFCSEREDVARVGGRRFMITVKLE